MKKVRLRLILLLWFMASMSIANTHIHHDTHEHSECVKCYAYNLMSGADVPIAEPIHFDLPHFSSVVFPDSIEVEKNFYTSINARAPPSL